MGKDGLTDKIKSKVSKVKGEFKDQLGNALGDASLQTEGKADKLKGKAQEKIGELKEKFSDK